MRYTAKEILAKAGIANPEEIVGKQFVSIGGLIVKSVDHKINTQDAKSVTVVVGEASEEVTL